MRVSSAILFHLSLLLIQQLPCHPHYADRTLCYRRPLRSCVTFYDRINYCMALPTDQEGVWEGACEDRYPCWKPALCHYYKCQLSHVLPNASIISCLDTPWQPQFYCYACSDCPVMGHDYVSRVVQCPRKGCAEWLDENGMLNRGCRDSSEWPGGCEKGATMSSVCRSCLDDYCNHAQYGLDCIQCSYDNPLCTYAPMNTWHSKCDLPITNSSRFGCFSRKR